MRCVEKLVDIKALVCLIVKKWVANILTGDDRELFFVRGIATIVKAE